MSSYINDVNVGSFVFFFSSSFVLFLPGSIMSYAQADPNLCLHGATPLGITASEGNAKVMNGCWKAAANPNVAL